MANHWIFLAVLFLAIAEQNAFGETGIITKGTGEIRVPMSEECKKYTPLTNTDINFRLILTQFTFLFVQTESCSEAFVTVNSARQPIFPCNSPEQPLNVLKGHFSISIAPYRGSCNNEIIGHYVILDMIVNIPPYPVSVGKNITIHVEIENIQSLNSSQVICSIAFGDGIKEQVSADFKSFYHMYHQPGRYGIKLFCIGPYRTDVSSYEYVAVESVLTKDGLIPIHIPLVITFQTAQIVMFQHIYMYPIEYCLVVGNYQIVKQIGPYQKDKFLNKEHIQVEFELSTTMQSNLKPGVHSVVLLMQNNVSAVVYETNVWVNQELREIKVTTDQFVGIHPNTFTINISLEQGCPANITIEINKYPNNELVSQMKTICGNPEECRLVQVTTSLNTAGQKFRAAVFSNNQISGVNGVSEVFETVPQVYDVYIISTKPVYVNKPNDLDIYIKGDIGTFELTLSLDGNSKNISFRIDKIEHVHLDTTNLPFNSKFYKLLIKVVIFKSSGVKTINASIWNSKQEFKFSSNVLVQKQPACLRSVKVRDGNMDMKIGEPLLLIAKVLLSADVVFSCADNSIVKFEWKCFKVATASEQPRLENEAQLKGSTYNNEIIVQNSDLQPGLYVIQLEVTTSDVEDKQLTAEARDFSLIEVPTRKLDILIKGGNKRNLGNQTAIKFEAEITSEVDLTVRLHYNWYCAVTLADLSRDIEVGKVKRTGSCFNQDPQWFGDDAVVHINNVKPDTRYFVRLIVTGKGFATAFADQEINVLSEAPVLLIRCWSNCKNKVSPNTSVIIQSECDSCVRHSWFFNSKIITECTNQTLCKLNTNLLQGAVLNNNFTAAGFDLFERRSSASLIFNVTSPPSGGKCEVFPPVGKSYITKYSITCNGYLHVFQPLMYKFYLKRIDEDLTLLQYGYDSSISNITFGTTGVAVIVDICNSLGACKREHVAVEVIPTPRSSVSTAINEINASIKGNNIQRLLQVVAPLSDTSVLTSAKRNEILNFASNAKLTSIESATQIVDVMRYVTDRPDQTDRQLQENAWKKLSDVQNLLKPQTKELSNRDLASITKSSISVASNLMQSSKSSINRRDETNKMRNMGRLLMINIVPGEKHFSYKTPGTEMTLLKLQPKTTDRLDAGSSQFQLLNAKQVSESDVINLEIYRYDAQKMNFNTSSRSVDFVTAVSLSTGWESQIPISSEKARNLPSRFTVPTKPTSSDLDLAIFSNCDVNKCNSYATGTAIFETRAGTNENLRGAFLRIFLGDSTHKVERWWTTLYLVESQPQQFNLSKEFTETKFDWWIPLAKLPQGVRTYNLTIHAYLGTQYFRLGSVIKTSLTTYAVNCMYWDDDIFDWNNEGCLPNVNSSESDLMCECDRFPVPPEITGRIKENNQRDVPTLFASRLIVYPNKIDYSKLSLNLWKKFLENPIIFVCLLILYISYAVLAVLARKKDVECKDKQAYIDVADNSPSDKYRYYVTIYTGNRRVADSSAIVCIKLIGSRKTDKVHILQNEGERIFTKGSVNSFLITSFSSLGNIVAVRLWHDNSGRSPEWFLQRMVVRDLETSECTFFICNTWFYDVIDHIFPAARTKDLHTFDSLFQIKCENYLKDQHMWYSILAMRPWQQSDMSRVERLSACYLLIFMIMLTSLMFYGREVSQPGFQIDLGYYSFKWSQIAVGLESGLLCFPMTYIVTTLIRYSQPRNRKKERNKDLLRLERGESIYPYSRHKYQSTSESEFYDMSHSSVGENGNLYEYNEVDRTSNRKVSFSKSTTNTSLQIGGIQEGGQRSITSEEVREINLRKKHPESPRKTAHIIDITNTEVVNVDENPTTRFNGGSDRLTTLDIHGRSIELSTSSFQMRSKGKTIDQNRLTSVSKVKQPNKEMDKTTEDIEAMSFFKFSPDSSVIPMDYTRHYYNTSWQGETCDAFEGFITASDSSSLQNQYDEPMFPPKVKEHKSKFNETLKKPVELSGALSIQSPIRSRQVTENKPQNLETVPNCHVGATDKSHGQGKSIASANYHRQIPPNADEFKTYYKQPVRLSRKTEMGKRRVLRPKVKRDAETQTPESMRKKRKTVCRTDQSKLDELSNHHQRSLDNDKALFPSAGMRRGEMYIDPKMVGSNPRSYTMVDIDPFSFDFRPFPWFFVSIAWFIIISTIIGSSVLCVMYGMTYGVEISKEWLVSLLSGFLQSIILIEPFKAIFLASFNVINNPKHDLRDWLSPVPEFFPPQNTRDPQLLDVYLEEERSRNPVYQPPDLKKMMESHEQRALERKMRRRLKKVSVHLLYLTFLMIVSFGQSEHNSFQFGQAINRMFVNDAKKIQLNEDIYKWMEHSLAGTLLSDHVAHFPDGQLVFVSGPLLRQKRVVSEVRCEQTESKFHVKLSGNGECRLRYDASFEDKQNYGPGWSKSHHYSFTNQYNDGNTSPWSYTSKPWTWISDYIGEHGNYQNGGYYVKITDGSQTRNTVQYLRSAKWLDRHSRTVILEAIFYNVPHRIYCITIISMEIPISGNVYVTSRLHFMRTHHVEYASDVIVYISLICILIMVFYHLVEIAGNIREIGFIFLWNVWNLFHVFVLLLSTAAVGVYLTRVTYTDMALKAYVNKVSSFELFHMAAYLDYVTRCLLSSCNFLTMFYTVKIMQGHPTFELMYATVRQSSGDLKGHSVLMFFIFCAFCHLGLLWFGDIKDFSSLVRTMQSVLGFSMEAFTSTDLLKHHPFLGGLFLFAFVVVFTKIFVNFYAVILENSFRECKLLMRDDIDGDHVVSFGRKQLRSMFAIKEQKLKNLNNPQEREEYVQLLENQTAQSKPNNDK